MRCVPQETDGQTLGSGSQDDAGFEDFDESESLSSDGFQDPDADEKALPEAQETAVITPRDQYFWRSLRAL
jgi:hypothetical protein